MIDTSELGAGANPTPAEKHITIVVEYEIDDEFPGDWTREDVLEYIKENLSDYTKCGNVVEIDI